MGIAEPIFQTATRKQPSSEQASKQESSEQAIKEESNKQAVSDKHQSANKQSANRRSASKRSARHRYKLRRLLQKFSPPQKKNRDQQRNDTCSEQARSTQTVRKRVISNQVSSK